MILDGYEVLTIAPDFATPPRIKPTLAFDSVMISPAPGEMFYRGIAPQHTLSFEFMLHGYENIRELQDFFHLHRGKWGEFYVPSWHQELVPSDDILSGTNQLPVHPVGYADLFDDAVRLESLGRHIFLIHQEGDLHVSRVSSVTGTDPEVLTLRTPVTRDFALGEYFAGFLYWVRFATDELELEYNGVNSAKTSITLMEMVHEEVSS